ncbi:hypothetical protein [Emergencia timonensis]|uniref:hypothetical protein n=1 Tax=Emergencia timonensis TaxID=1776384 RepID=UPI0024A88E66|nr:hypothetical protein [Emergencia timonensis]
MKRGFCIFAAVLMAMSIPVFAGAGENGANTAEFQLHHNAEPNIVDTVSVDFAAAKTSTAPAKVNGIRPSIFTRTMEMKDRKTGKTVAKLKYQIQVDFYESGSFRAFYGASSPMLMIEDAIVPMKLANTAEGVKSTTDRYPCTSLTYNYSTNLCTTEPVSAKVGKLPTGAGFSATEDRNPYYIGTVFDTGTIDLYYQPSK